MLSVVRIVLTLSLSLRTGALNILFIIIMTTTTMMMMMMMMMMMTVSLNDDLYLEASCIQWAVMLGKRQDKNENEKRKYWDQGWFSG